VVAGLAVLLLVIVLGVVLMQGDDDASTTTDAERDTTTSETPSRSETGTEVFYWDLSVGDCFNNSGHGTPNIGAITRVDCGSMHDAEMFALVTLPGTPDTPYPGDSEIYRQGGELCQAEFAPYVGSDYLESQWAFGFIGPTEDSWRRSDDRLVVCYLDDPNFNKIEGSKRNSRT
jgi:hypothetical protein